MAASLRIAYLSPQADCLASCVFGRILCHAQFVIQMYLQHIPVRLSAATVIVCCAVLRLHQTPFKLECSRCMQVTLMLGTFVAMGILPMTAIFETFSRDRLSAYRKFPVFAHLDHLICMSVQVVRAVTTRKTVELLLKAQCDCQPGDPQVHTQTLSYRGLRVYSFEQQMLSAEKHATACSAELQPTSMMPPSGCTIIHALQRLQSLFNAASDCIWDAH